MSDLILFRYTPDDVRELTDEERALGISEPIIPSFPGVPLRDLVESDLEYTPWWIVRSLDASPLYQATSDGVQWLADHNPERATPPVELPAPDTGEETV